MRVSKIKSSLII